MGSAILTGLGLAAPAGLNAYLPLLIVALAARYTHLITLDSPYDFVYSLWGIGLLTLLLTVEVVADKIPGVDHLNDLIQSPLRPAAGAVLMMAATREADALNPVVAMVVGLLVAGGVHAAKATARPLVTVTTGGLGNPLVSLVEDAAAAAVALVALLAPLLVGVLILGCVGLWVWGLRRLRRLGRGQARPHPSADLRR